MYQMIGMVLNVGFLMYVNAVQAFHYGRTYMWRLYQALKHLEHLLG